MDKIIKELYNKMNKDQLYEQFMYLNHFWIANEDHLSIYEINDILEQRAYVWNLRKNLEMANEKKNMKLLTIEEKKELEEKISPIKSVVKGVFRREISDVDSPADEVCIMLINGLSARVCAGYCDIRYKGLEKTHGRSQEPILYTLEELGLFQD